MLQMQYQVKIGISKNLVTVLA